MRITIKSLIYLVLCSINIIFSDEYYYCQNLKSPLITLTIPKSGTHLIDKCIRLLLDSEFEKIPQPKDIIKLPFKTKNHLYLLKHFDSMPHASIRTLLENHNGKIIVNIRDFRDVIISFSNRSFTPSTFTHNPLAWDKMNHDERIMHFIQTNFIFSLSRQLPELSKTLNTYPDILIVKFENLIGPKGGGSAYLQKNEILKIARYLDIEIDDQKLDYVITNLFGGTRHLKRAKLVSGKIISMNCIKRNLRKVLVHI